MKRLKSVAKRFITKHGNALIAAAFVFVTISANSPCTCPFYEPDEPVGLSAYKKTNGD